LTSPTNKNLKHDSKAMPLADKLRKNKILAQMHNRNV
jgi:hypothetical protein